MSVRDDAAQQHADVVAGLGLVEQLAEHLHTGDDGLVRVADADDLDLVADFDDTALDTAGGDRTAAGDGEDVLDGHEERLFDVALRLGDVGVDGFHELGDGAAPVAVALAALALERLESRAVMTGVSSPGNSYSESSSRTSISTSSSSSGSSTMSTLFR
jgi:hypothetical protein